MNFRLCVGDPFMKYLENVIPMPVFGSFVELAAGVLVGENDVVVKGLHHQ